MLIERSKSARARPVTAGAAMAQTTSEHASAAAVRGMPVVQSTGEIELQGHQIRLYGMEGVRGHTVNNRPARMTTSSEPFCRSMRVSR
jgi:hypothetical protein